MDYYFNKTLNFQKLYQEDLAKLSNNLHVQKTLPKSKSSNELIAKKQEKENPSNNIFLNTWGFNKSGQLANSSSVLKTSQLNLIKLVFHFYFKSKLHLETKMTNQFLSQLEKITVRF